MQEKHEPGITFGAVRLFEDFVFKLKRQLYDRMFAQAKADGTEDVNEELAQRIINSTVVTETSVSE